MKKKEEDISLLYLVKSGFWLIQFKAAGIKCLPLSIVVRKEKRISWVLSSADLEKVTHAFISTDCSR